MNKTSFTDNDLKQAAALVRRSMVESLPTYVPNEHEFSFEFEAKMQQVFKQEKAYRARQAVVRKVVAALLALLISAVSWLTFDTQARASFFAWIRSVYENSIVYEFFASQNEETGLPNYELGNLPEGLQLVEEIYTNQRCSKVYMDDTTGDTILFQYSKSSEHVAVYVIEPDTTIQNKTVSINGDPVDICLSVSTGITSVSWYDDKSRLFFSVDSNLEEVVLIDILNDVCLNKS